MSKIVKEVRQHFSNQNYSRDRWATHSESSTQLIPFLRSLDANLIIDVGCGTNPYKEQVVNLIGLDAANYPEADINLACEEVHDLNIFQPGCADAVMALGSINFGSWENIVNQIGICVDWCKSGGYIILRARLGDHTKRGNNRGMDQYNWTVEDVSRITEHFKDKVEMYKDPVVETAAGGQEDAHGKPDYDRKINLVVWYWKRK